MDRGRFDVSDRDYSARRSFAKAHPPRDDATRTVDPDGVLATPARNRRTTGDPANLGWSSRTVVLDGPADPAVENLVVDRQPVESTGTSGLTG